MKTVNYQSAVSNASSVPEIDLAEETIDVTPRTMDTDPTTVFFNNTKQSGLGMAGIIDSGVELRPPLENFGPAEMTIEKALENRIADIEIRSNNNIDETDTETRIVNQNIQAFESVDMTLQQSVDLSA